MRNIPDEELQKLVLEIIKRCRKEHGKGNLQRIADAMTPLVGRTVTASMLHSFTRSDRREVRFPASWIRAFCAATEDDALARAVLPDHLRATLEIGENVRQAAGSLDKARELVAKLQGPSPSRKARKRR